jgi:hypothetical protein
MRILVRSFSLDENIVIPSLALVRSFSLDENIVIPSLALSRERL